MTCTPVLRELGLADAIEHTMIDALNKIDRLDQAARDQLLSQAARDPRGVPISAVTGEGCDAVLAAIDRRLAASRQTLRRAPAPPRQQRHRLAL